MSIQMVTDCKSMKDITKRIISDGIITITVGNISVKTTLANWNLMGIKAPIIL